MADTPASNDGTADVTPPVVNTNEPPALPSAQDVLGLDTSPASEAGRILAAQRKRSRINLNDDEPPAEPPKKKDPRRIRRPTTGRKRATLLRPTTGRKRTLRQRLPRQIPRSSRSGTRNTLRRS
jgi:hypothetical protein